MAEFSKITLTFLEDFELGYEARLSTSLNDLVTTQTWDWVVTRSAAFEVTTGTPTANAGERTAINFAAAFELDNPTNFIVNVDVNRVEIISETEGLLFLGLKVENDSGIPMRNSYTIVFDNYIPPLDLTVIDFALVKSPHYINIPFVFETTTAANVDVYVWDGDVNTPPASATYSLTIPRPTIDFAEFNIDISNLIGESLEPKPIIQASDATARVNSTADSVKWVKYIASYEDTTETIANTIGLFIATDGYGYYNEGANPTKPDDLILTNSRTRQISRNGIGLIPYVNDGTITVVKVTSYPNNDIDETFNIPSFELSEWMIQYIQLNLNFTNTDDTDIQVVFSGVGQTVIYKIIDECKYTPIQVVFKNKYGAF